MTSKKSLLTLACAAALAAPAYAAQSFGDRARVVSSTPVYERIPVTREECWNERQRTYEDRRVTRTDTGAPIGAGTVLGAVIGGAVGRQFGDSNRGKNQGTAAGAIVGGLIGHQIESDTAGPPVERTTTEYQRVPVERNVERCRNVQEVREATIGYDVRYEYAGRQFTTRLDRDPGRMLRVRVDVSPEEGREQPAPPPRPGPRPPAYR
jgi:uncharacterized protein YcfJ